MTHKVQIKSIEKIDLYEGTITFSIQENEYQAFFYGEEFEKDEIINVNFEQLEYPLDWEIIFNKNIKSEKRIEKARRLLQSFVCWLSLVQSACVSKR